MVITATPSAPTSITVRPFPVLPIALSLSLSLRNFFFFVCFETFVWWREIGDVKTKTRSGKEELVGVLIAFGLACGNWKDGICRFLGKSFERKRKGRAFEQKYFWLIQGFCLFLTVTSAYEQSYGPMDMFRALTTRSLWECDFSLF